MASVPHDSGRPWRGRRTAVLAAVVVAASALSLVLRAQVPLLALPSLAFDDGLFARQAASLLDGAWLGPFDVLTLAKGPGYPLFIAAAYEAGLPVKLAEQVVQLLAAGLLALGAGRLTGRPVLGVVLFVVVALDPVHLAGEAARLNRTGLYASLSTAVLGLLLLAASFARAVPRGRSAVPAVVATGVGLGAVAFAALVTREEGVALLPVAGAALLAALWLAGACGPRVGWRDRRAVGRRLLPVLAVGALAAVTAWAGLTAVEARNEAEYGVATVTDFAGGELPRLFAALAAVDVGEPRPYVPISQAQRRAAYAASPAFARLRGQLEGDGHATRWIEPGCDALGICDDYAGGWVPWALRAAALRSLGEQRTAPALQEVFARAADEVAAACGRAYPCRSTTGYLPRPQSVPAGELVQATGRGLAQVVSYEAPGYRAQRGTQEQYELFTRSVRGLPDRLAEQERRVDAASTAPHDVLRALYAGGTALALLPALVGLLWWRDRGQRLLQVVGAVLVAAVLTRVGLLALVDVTSFPAVGTGYMLPAFDPAAAAVVVGAWSLAVVVRAERQAGRWR